MSAHGSNEAHVELRLFGAFRAVGDGRMTELSVPVGTTIGQFRSELRAHLARVAPSFDAAIVSDSQFANEMRVLRADERIEGSCTLSTLPPVCGG